MSTTKYTVLTYNINNYEIVHPIKEKSDRAKYIMVTDDPTLKDESGSWEIICDDTLTGSPFDKTLQVRYNAWKYTDDYIVLLIDGSVGIEKNLDPLIDRFIKEDADISIMLHPTRSTLVEEYSAWVQTRGYDPQQANSVLAFMAMAEGYPVKEFKGLAQLCFLIEKHDPMCENLNRMTYAFAKFLGNNADGIERVDQCVFSFILQKYFNTAKIMYVDQRMYNGEASKAPFQWYPHNSDIPFRPMETKDMKEPYFFNKRIHNAIRPQDL